MKPHSRSILRFFVVGIFLASPFRVFAQEAVTVTCTDGSSSKSGKGACSHHGGVAKGGPAKTSTTAPSASSQTSPSAPAAPGAAGPAVICKDGTTSAHGGRGACSGHGGIAKGMTTKAPANDNASAPTPPVATKANAPSLAPRPSASSPKASGNPTAKCKDGSMSFSKQHSGSCSHHGGVAQWLDGSR